MKLVGRFLPAALLAVFSFNTFAQDPGHACINGLGMGNQQIWWTGTSKFLMDFTGGPPVLSNAGIGQTASFEGTAVYTTPSGDLLLYTDGNAIFNGQTHALIGTGVGGNPSSTEAALIVPDPAGVPTNDFYVFGNSTNVTGSAINYALVDIAGNSISAVTALDGGLAFGESLATVPHANGTDFWILSVTSASPQINAYLVTAGGVSGAPVSSALPAFPGGTTANRGNLIYHPPTGQLAIGFYSNPTTTGYIFTAQFDESTGMVTAVTQRATGALGYGVAFSPDASKLYYSVGTEGWAGTITHYDIATATATAIQGGSWGMPRMGPDNRVYVVTYLANTMGVINSPNAAFASIDWNPTGVALPAGATNGFSLVNQTYAPCDVLNENVPPVSAFTYSCTDLDCSFDGSTSSDSDGIVTDWDWDFGDAGVDSGVNAAHSFGAPGSYLVALLVTDDDLADNLSQQLVTVTLTSEPQSTVPVPLFNNWALILLVSLLFMAAVITSRKKPGHPPLR